LGGKRKKGDGILLIGLRRGERAELLRRERKPSKRKPIKSTRHFPGGKKENRTACKRKTNPGVISRVRSVVLSKKRRSEKGETSSAHPHEKKIWLSFGES